MILILIYPCYKSIRELVWVNHAKYSINNFLQIKLRTDPDIFGFQDLNIEKTITVINSKTKASLKISYISLEPNLYFFLDTSHAINTLTIADQFAGQNIYDLATLILISKEDCLKNFGGCGGFNDSAFSKLGTPGNIYLLYDGKGFVK